MSRYALRTRLTGTSEANSINKWFGGGFAALPSTSYESIQTQSVTSTVASITFTSIPATYTHLQIRGIGKSSRNATYDNLYMQFNGDTNVSNYTTHIFQGDRSSISIQSYPVNIAAAGIGNSFADASSNASNFGTFIIDILDYKNTNKYKTTRMLGGEGVDGASSGVVGLTSGLWNSSTTITSINIKPGNGNLLTNSTFALYGIKVA